MEEVTSDGCRGGVGQVIVQCVDAVGELAHVDFGVPHVAAETGGHALPVVSVEPVLAGSSLGPQSAAQHQSDDCNDITFHGFHTLEGDYLPSLTTSIWTFSLPSGVD